MNSESSKPTNVGSNDQLGLVDRLRQCLPTMNDGPDDKTWCSVLGADLRAAIDAIEDALEALDDECNRTDSLLTILGVPAERCRSEGGSLIPRKVLTLMGETHADDVADATRFRWMFRYPDWYFIEHLCNHTNATTSAEFLADMRRVIDARRSVDLNAFEQHVPPKA